jgi:superfamily II DNA or RNA helicase
MILGAPFSQVPMASPFPDLRFQGQLRPSQRDVVEIARRKLNAGHRRLHIVAPPGSGKTVLGLYLWAEIIRAPALVLSPNSAIQAQWASRVELFGGPTLAGTAVSTDPESPGLLTSLTYQAVTLPRRGGDDLDTEARDLWIQRLVEKGQAKDPEEAEVWIRDLAQHNPDFYEDRLGGYRKAVRDAAALNGQALQMLHASSRATLDRLRQAGLGLIILDECHHLLTHWGRVLAEAHESFDQPIVLGLTATPPDRRGKLPEDIQRYDAFFGPVDYEVPVPAVVKDGFLAPYQDLVQFVRPTADELAFLAKADDQWRSVVQELCQPRAPAAARSARVSDLRSARVSDLRSARVSDPADTPDRRSPENRETFGQPGGSVGRPATAPEPPAASGPDVMSGPDVPAVPPRTEPLPAWLTRVLAERRLPVGQAHDWAGFEQRDPEFAAAARSFLTARRCPLPADVPLAPHTAAGPWDLTLLVPVLDRYLRHGLRASAHPDDHALAERTIRRLRMLGVQVTEHGTQACASPISRVLAYARGKAAAVIPILRAERQALGDRLRAVVVADFEKTSAVSAEVQHLLDEEAGGAIAAFRTLLSDPETDALNPVLVTGSSVLVDDDLAPRFLEAAETWLTHENCDVRLTWGDEQGFQVLHGQGADWCPRVYVAMITELFQRGLTRCLVGTRGLLGEGWDADKVNVLIDLTTVTTSTSVNQLRGRSLRLDPEDPDKLADNWDVVCVAPEFVKGLDDYARFIDKHDTLFGLTDDGAIEKGVGHVHAAFTQIRPEGIEGSLPLLNAEMLQRPLRRTSFRPLWRIGQPYHPEPIHALELRPSGPGWSGGFPPWAGAAAWTTNTLILAIGEAVLGALREADLVQAAGSIHVGERAGGYVRAFLEQASEADSDAFTAALEEAVGPLDRPRYVIPRYVDVREDTWLSRILPGLVAKYFQRQHRTLTMYHAVPSALAKHKDLVAVYNRHWNRHVSLGEAVYAHRGAGDELVANALRDGLSPTAQLHRKEVFR